MRNFSNAKILLRCFYYKHCLNKRVLHFLHIGKTGGTAMKEALTPHAKSGDWLIKLHGHNVTLENVPAGEGVIFFLRDPLTRYVSGFYSRQRQGHPRYFYPWSSDEKTAFERFATPNQLALALSDENVETRAAAQKAHGGTHTFAAH